VYLLLLKIECEKRTKKNTSEKKEEDRRTLTLAIAKTPLSVVIFIGCDQI